MTTLLNQISIMLRNVHVTNYRFVLTVVILFTSLATFGQPSPPSLISATNITSTGFRINWNLVSGADGYVVDVSTDINFNSFVYQNLNAFNNSGKDITGLTPNTTYYYRARAYSFSTGTSGNSGVGSQATLAGTPSPPTASAATSLTNVSFVANWSTAANATSYALDVSTSSSFGSFVSGYNNLSVGGTSATVNNLSENTTYYYRVRGVNSFGSSANSNTITVLTLCGAPIAVSPSNNTGTSFTANWLPVSGASFYKLDVSTVSNFASFVSGYNDLTVNGTNQSVSGLSNGVVYYYRLRAVNTSGASANSNTVTVLPLPDAPTATAATSVTTTSFTANWNAGANATGYEVDVSTVSNFSSLVYGSLISGTTSLNITGLTANTTYYYRVRSTNSSGVSSNSNTQSIITAPDAPSTTAATNLTSSSFQANWTGGTVQYRLDVSSASDFSSFLSGYNNTLITATNETITGLTAGAPYYYRVRAVNAGGTSANSNVTSVTLTLSAPTASAASSLTNVSFTANWGSVSGATSYYLDVSTSSGFGSFVSGYNNLNVGGTSSSVSGLAPNTTYYYRVRATNGPSTSSNSNTISTLTLLNAPIAIGPTGHNGTSFTANWQSVTGATDYRLDVSTVSNFASFVGSYNNLTVNGTSQSVSGLTNGVTYYYRVRSVNASGASANSNTITVLPLPGAPTATAATSVTTTSFTANWNAGTNATGYEVDVSTVSNFASLVYGSLISGTTSLNITGLTANTTYYYRVRSTNSSGVSANSNTQSIITVPAAPTTTAATNLTSSSFQANWTGGTVQYQLDVSTASNFSSFLSGYNSALITASNETITGLTAGVPYYYRVRAVNASGTSTNSNVTSVTLTLPAPTASAASSLTNVSFTANWGSVAGATSYYLDVSTSSGFGSFVSGYNNLNVGGTSSSVSGLAPNTTYFYRVRATNGLTTSSNSNTISTLTLLNAPIAIGPTGHNGTSFTANWQSVTGAIDYRLDVSTVSNFASFVGSYNNLTVNGTSQSVSGLTNGVTYYYRVRAVNASGASANSNTITVLPLPGTPTATAATSVTTTSFMANWNAGTDATGYEVDVAAVSDFTSLVYGSLISGTTSLNITSLTANTTYYYRVRSTNSSGVSANSNAQSIITVPAAPTTTAATNLTGSSFQANWTGGTVQYQLDVSTASDFSSFLSGYNSALVTASNATITGLTAGVPYYYRVRSVNASGTSTNSNVTSVTLTLPPPTATAATLLTNVSFTANWGPVTSATGYFLDVSTSSGFGTFVTGYNNLSVTGTSRSVTSLSPNTTYFYRVRATNGLSTSLNSNTISILTLLTAPIATGVTNHIGTSFTASWQSVTGATDYRLDVSTVSNFASFVGIYNNLTVNGTNQSVSGLTNGVTYYYRVRAVNASGPSANSNTITVLPLPGLPTATAASLVTTTSFKANWNAGTNATGYQVDVSLLPDFSTFVYSNLTSPTTNLTISGLTANTTYHYRVRSTNSSGVSGNSNTQAIITAPSAPTATAATTIGETSFVANWNSTATQFHIDVSSDNFLSFVSGFNNFLVVNSNSVTVAGLTGGTTYAYRVRAINGSGESTNSNTINALTLCAPPVANDASSISQSGFTVSWSSPTSATGYRLDVSTLSDFSIILSSYDGLQVAGTSTNVTGLDLVANDYYYRVRAENSSGVSSNSNVITTIKFPFAPNALASTNVTESSFTANWFSVSTATGYQLDVATDNQFTSMVTGYNNLPIAGGSTVSYNVTGLILRTVYYYRVRAVNTSGVSPHSNAIIGANYDQNFVRSIEVLAEGKLTSADVESAPMTDKTVTFNFFDGLGRPSQTVSVQGSPSQNDIVVPIQYDEFGRQKKTFLSYTSPSTAWFRADALMDPQTTATTEIDKYRSGKQYEFYQVTPDVATDDYPYSESAFEPSPLNRVLKQGAPGQPWQPSANPTLLDDKTVKKQYEFNIAGDVLLWRYDLTTHKISAKDGGGIFQYYPANTLFANKMYDEENHLVIEYVDKEGRTILKRVQATPNQTPIDHLNYACTYYIYDDLGNLAVVLPPEAVKTIITNN